jgi:glycosyltransferase involved in cell wall biosynthesis
VTVHDLGYLYYPRMHTEQDYRYLDWSTKFSARRASRIMADSETTRQDLIKHYAISPEKIDVVYPGVDETLNVVHDPETLAAIRKKYDLPERYLLFIGTLQPRKNVGRLIKAFNQWRTESGSQNQDVVLALAGRPGWLYDPSWQEGVENVEVLGYVEDEDISALYSGALAFLMPSLFEGFGFPILEAMRCETPVLCSNTSSMPELAGDAAILVDPIDVKAIAAGIDKLVSDAKLRAALVERGKVQAAKFTWEAAARNALAVLERA